MATSPSLPKTPESKEDADYNRICEEYNHLIETMAKANGWRVQHLYNYNGFWIQSVYIKANLLLHAYFKPQPTDIFLSFMKSGTTWLKALMKYEEVKKQPEMVVRKLGGFMGEPFTVEEEEKGVVEKIVNLCSFETLSNLEVNKKGVVKFGKVEVENREFFRRGVTGDWKNYLTEEMKERLDGIIHEKLKGYSLIFGESA